MAELQTLMEVSDEQISKFQEQVKFRPKFKSYVLKSNLTEKEVALFSVNQHHFPGASVEARLERYYPYAGDLVHVLGRMGAITEKDLEKKWIRKILEQNQEVGIYSAKLRGYQ